MEFGQGGSVTKRTSQDKSNRGNEHNYSVMCISLVNLLFKQITFNEKLFLKPGHSVIFI